MTFIYDVMTWAREGTKVEGRLTDLTGDGVRFYRGPEFGLQLLMDAWFHGCGASELDGAIAAEFEECFELFLGKKVWTDDEGFLLNDTTKERAEPQVKAAEHFDGLLDSSSGYWDGYNYLVLKPSSDEFLKRTAAIIASFTIDGDEAGEQASFTIEATDPKYVAHMRQNHYYKTTFTGHLPR